MIVFRQELELIKRYEQKFCYCPNHKIKPNRIIFVLEVFEKVLGIDDSIVIVKWIDPEDVTDIRDWAVNYYDDVEKTLKIIC